MADKEHESHLRVTPWQEGDPAPLELVAAIKERRGGELYGLDRVLLKSVPLAEGWNEFFSRMRQHYSLELEYRELIMCRVAVLNGAEFEWKVHEAEYLKAGGTKEKSTALKTDISTKDNNIFDEIELTLIALTDASTKRVVVEEEIITKLKQKIGETKTVEAVATVAGYNCVSRFLVALGI